MSPKTKARALWDKGVKKWRSRLWLGRWGIDSRYVDKLESIDGSPYMTLAEAHSDPQYLKGTIEVALPSAAVACEDSLNRSVCHELVHFVQSPLRHVFYQVLNELPASKREGFDSWWSYVNEQTTEHWCNVLLDAHKEPTDCGHRNCKGMG